MNTSLPTLRQSAIITIITVALLIMLEGGVRFLFPARESAYVFHPEYLFSLSPNKTHVFQRAAKNGGQIIQWHVNSHGHRGKETSPHEGGLRIMVYGDSNIQAAFSELESTFPNQLGAILKDSIGAEIEVLNMGVAGYSPAQSLLQMRNEIDLWCPDAIVVHLFADNDYGDLIRNKLFHISENGRLIHNTKAADLRKQLLQQKGTQKQESRISQLIQKTHTYRVMRRALARVRSGSVEAKPARSSAPKSIADRIQGYFSVLEMQYASYVQNDIPEHLTPVLYDLDLALEPARESSRTKRDLMENLLEQIGELSTQRTMPVVFLLQPSVRDVATNQSPNFTHFVEFSDEYRRSYLTDLLEGMVIKAVSKGHSDISHVNLFKYFRVDGESPYYFKGDDDHWNDAGQRLAAELVAEHFLVRHMESITDKGFECRAEQ